MKQVFLSYARFDSRKAANLYQELAAGGSLRVWFDQHDLLPGMRWQPAIRKAIRESRYFIALVSRKAVSRKGFRHTELRQALEVLREFPDDQIFLIPTRLDECEMPADELRELTYADLFPTWREGIGRLRAALGDGSPRAPSRRKIATKKETKKSARRRVPHYRISLAGLDFNHTELAQVARGLSGSQSMFGFTASRLSVPRAALVTIEGNEQIHLESVPPSFYDRLSTLDVDYVLCLTKRFLAFDEGRKTYFNYLASPAPGKPTVRFISIGSLGEHATAAGVPLRVAIASRLVSEIVNFFLNVGYHKQTRDCPMDYTEDHADLVGGFRSGRFCSYCSKHLAKNAELESAVKAMIAWGRPSSGARPTRRGR